MLRKTGEGHHVFPSCYDSGPSGHCSRDLVGAGDSTAAQQDLLHLPGDQGEMCPSRHWLAEESRATLPFL